MKPQIPCLRVFFNRKFILIIRFQFSGPVLNVNSFRSYREIPFLGHGPALCRRVPEVAYQRERIDTPHGGHVGFIAFYREMRYWSEARILCFIRNIDAKQSSASKKLN